MKTPGKAEKQDLGLNREITPDTLLLVQSYLEEGCGAEYIASELNRDIDIVEALIALGQKKGWSRLRGALHEKLKAQAGRKEGYRK